jgi:hypothetical protein
LTITTPNKGDGWIPIPASEESPQSELHLPHKAPETGYDIQELSFRKTQLQTKVQQTNTPADADFFFRIRTELDDKGQVKQAHYGKLVGPIGCWIDGTNKWQHDFKYQLDHFTYYLNPEPNSRNMEFNTRSNLFKNLSSLERVSAP